MTGGELPYERLFGRSSGVGMQVDRNRVLEGRVVIVTGGARGSGEAEAQLSALCGNPAYDIVRRESLVKQAAILQARGQNEQAAKLLEEALTLEQVETTNADILFGLLMIHASNQDWERLLNVSERLSAVSDAKNMYTVSGAFYGIAARRELDSAYDAKAAFSAMAQWAPMPVEAPVKRMERWPAMMPPCVLPVTDSHIRSDVAIGERHGFRGDRASGLAHPA